MRKMLLNLAWAIGGRIVSTFYKPEPGWSKDYEKKINREHDYERIKNVIRRCSIEHDFNNLTKDLEQFWNEYKGMYDSAWMVGELRSIATTRKKFINDIKTIARIKNLQKGGKGEVEVN